MRILLCCAMSVLLIGSVVAQEVSASTRQSLAEVLGAEKVLSFAIDNDTRLYTFFVLLPDEQQHARVFYASKERMKASLAELETRMDELRQSGDRGSDDYRKQYSSLVAERLLFRRSAGEVTRYGRDFIGVRDFGTNRELLIPVHRIVTVLAPTLDK